MDLSDERKKITAMDKDMNETFKDIVAKKISESNLSENELRFMIGFLIGRSPEDVAAAFKSVVEKRERGESV